MCTKKDVGMWLFVQCFYALSLHLVSVVFGTAIPTSLYIFGKCFIYLFVSFLLYNSIGGCCSIVHFLQAPFDHMQTAFAMCNGLGVHSKKKLRTTTSLGEGAEPL